MNKNSWDGNNIIKYTNEWKYLVSGVLYGEQVVDS